MDQGAHENVVVISPPDEETEVQTAIGIGAPPSPRNSPTRARVHVPPRLGHSRSASLSTGPALSPLRNTFGPSIQSNGTNGASSNPAYGFPSPSPTSLRFAFPANGGPQSNLAPGHQPRIRSISANYAAIPSPLALSASNGYPHSPDQPNALPSSTTLPNMGMGFGMGLPPSPGSGMGPPSPSGSEVYLPLDSSSGTSPPPPTSPLSAGISPATAAAHQKRRHSRMHSRNLSVFFPRPGQVPSAINEDGDANATDTVNEEDGQELEVPSSYIPSAGSNVSLPGSRRYSRGAGNNPPITPLGAGFKFGSRPPPELLNDNPELPPIEDEQQQLPRAKKRGHHHKHSMSHNFFSFLEPGSGGLPSSRASELHTQPTPTPMSPWAPISALPDSAKHSQMGHAAVPVSASYNGGHTHSHHSHSHSHIEPTPNAPFANVVGLGQFALGAYIWVLGQQIGSLSVTGLGYWIVFDSFGVGVGCVLPGRLAASLVKGGEKVAITRPYGNGRYEALYLFSQAVYLMFSSVYICKETVEHLLLSAGGEGHHHHSGDEEKGGHAAIQFPLFILFSILLTLIGTALFYENNARLVNLAGNRLPTPHTLLRSITLPFQPRSNRRNAFIEPPPSHPLLAILTNPYSVWPMVFCMGIMSVALFVPSEHHRLADLCLSSLIAIVTFNVAYRACVVLGAVLLQTSPPRGLPSGKMESFLRAMREVERHPHVLHLPAPHIWQLTPSASSSSSSTSSASSISSPSPHSHSRLGGQSKTQPDQLVVTLQVHVKHDLADDDVLALTKWVWERCVGALGGYKEFNEVGEVGGPEISVGVVRG